MNEDVNGEKVIKHVSMRAITCVNRNSKGDRDEWGKRLSGGHGKWSRVFLKQPFSSEDGLKSTNKADWKHVIIS